MLQRLTRLALVTGAITCATAAIAVSSALAFPTGSTVTIDAQSNPNLVFNAQGCVSNTHVILYPWGTGSCYSGHNMLWTFYQTASGYDSIYANYGSGYQCLNVAGGNYSNGTDIYAWSCDPVNPTSNEKFRRPENTIGNCGAGYQCIVPAGNWSKCLNARNGVSQGAQIQIWDCYNANQEHWVFTG